MCREFTYPTRRPTAEEIPSAPQPQHSEEVRGQQSSVRQTPRNGDVHHHEETPVPKSATHKPSVSALRLSLQAGLPPASSARHLEFCTHDDDLVRGTGVYAFPSIGLESTYGRTPLEIGTRNITREAWARDLGTGNIPPETTVPENVQMCSRDETDDDAYDLPKTYHNPQQKLPFSLPQFTRILWSAKRRSCLCTPYQ